MIGAPPMNDSWTLVRTARTLGDATLLLQALENEGLSARLRGEHRVSLAGELPLLEAEVELWVEDRDVTRAREVLEALSRPDWAPAQRCKSCGEENPGNFELCWKCQTVLG